MEGLRKAGEYYTFSRTKSLVPTILIIHFLVLPSSSSVSGLTFFLMEGLLGMVCLSRRCPSPSLSCSSAFNLFRRRSLGLSGLYLQLGFITYNHLIKSALDILQTKHVLCFYYCLMAPWLALSMFSVRSY